MLKSLDKKFLIMAGVIISLPIVTIVLLSILQGCEGAGNSYDSYEKNMEKAASKYFKTNKLLPSSEGKISKVSLATLVNKKMIKDPDKSLNDSNCTGNVSVRLNGSSLEKNEGGFLNYIVNLKCKKYETTTLSNAIMDSITTSDSGLYYVDGEYIFKGNKLKNYIKFYGKEYRIMGINNNGMVKLIRSEAEPITRIWDNKYNLEIKFSYGKTIYKDSSLLQNLLDDYSNNKKYSLEAKKHIMANDVCIGKRDKKDTRISRELDCSEIIEKQLITIMNVSDYALASTDPDCNNVISKSCNNYNYLYRVASSTWTTNTVTDNTYEVLYLENGTISTTNANDYNPYNVIIYIDANEKISSGKGTLEDPFVIK